MTNITTKTIAILALVISTNNLSADYTINTELDVTKFSKVWHQLQNSEESKKDGYRSIMDGMLDSSITVAYEECSPAIDTAKFTSLWGEVNTNNNKLPHLTQALDSVVDEVVCIAS